MRSKVPTAPVIGTRIGKLPDGSKKVDSSRQYYYDDGDTINTNNSMPIADKPYDPPVLPEEIDAYQMNLGATAKQYRETYRPERRTYTTVFLRVRRKYYEQLLWQLLSTNVITKETMYMPETLPYWTIGLRLRLKNIYPLGRVMEAMKNRLGITNPGLRFCIDGFYGMFNYTDIFGNTSDACPWMEISNFSTIDSLRMKDGDSIFLNIVSAAQIENVNNWRKKHALETATSKQALDLPLAVEEEEEDPVSIG